MLLNKKKCYKKPFFGFRPFWPFFNKKQPKLTKNEENWQNPYRLVKFSEIWYVDASQQNKMLHQNFFLDFSLFWPFFNKKTAKIDQNEDWQNLNCLIKFFEIWFVDASQQKKMLQKNYFSILSFSLFLAK